MANVVITGSTRGIGLAMAKEFLKKDCNVTISGRAQTPSAELEKEISGFKSKALYVVCDVRNRDEVENLWDSSYSKWGSIDIWINNAGQNCPYKYCYDIEKSYVDSVIDINLKGVIFGCQVAAKNMLAQQKGQIWNMEGLGSNDMVQEKTIIYGTTKRALTYFTKALAKELKNTPVKVGRLSPGMMLTDLITKTPDGSKSPLIEEKNFKFIFNILADRPETVAAFLVPRILANNKNNAQIAWLTNLKVLWRFITGTVKKRKLI